MTVIQSTETLPTPKERIVLKSPIDTVELRQMMPEEAGIIYNLFNSNRGHIKKFLPFLEEDIESEAVLLSRIKGCLGNERVYKFGIWDNDSLIGAQSFYVDSDNTGETTTWIGEKFIGNNYAARARDLLIEFAFKQIKVKELHCRIDRNNIASIASVKKSKFSYSHSSPMHDIYTLTNPLPLTKP